MRIDADLIHERKHFPFCREIDHADAGEVNIHLYITVTTGLVVVVYLNASIQTTQIYAEEQ